MVFNSGELTLVEYGRNEILGSLRTEQTSSHLISVRLSDGRDPTRLDQQIRKVAYLIDLNTIRIGDLSTGVTDATISHEARIDWMEMNQRATKLLFRDKRRALHLFDIASQTRSTLLSFSSYVQWVPDSDVVVAQSRSNLCVWYHIDAPDRVTVVPIKGGLELGLELGLGLGQVTLALTLARSCPSREMSRRSSACRGAPRSPWTRA